jgi:hypothetical protein
MKIYRPLLGTLIGISLLAIAAAAQPYSAPVVKDSSTPPRIIGPYFPASPSVFEVSDTVLVKLNGTWALLPVDTQGFVNTGIVLEFKTVDCSGPPFLGFGDAIPLVAAASSANEVGVVGGKAYFPNYALAQSCGSDQIFLSTQLVSPDGSPFPCTAAPQGCGLYAPAITFDLSTLGFTPPFQIKR